MKSLEVIFFKLFMEEENTKSTCEGNNLRTLLLGKFDTEIGIVIFFSEKRSTYNSTLTSEKL